MRAIAMQKSKMDKLMKVSSFIYIDRFIDFEQKEGCSTLSIFRHKGDDLKIRVDETYCHDDHPNVCMVFVSVKDKDLEAFENVLEKVHNDLMLVCYEEAKSAYAKVEEMYGVNLAI